MSGIGPLTGLRDRVFLSAGFRDPGILFSNFGMSGFIFIQLNSPDLGILCFKARAMISGSGPLLPPINIKSGNIIS